MPQKRNASGEPNGANGPPSKQVKSEQHPEEFSNTVKKKLQASSRTGQACDRCKVRKIRCDGLPGGCSPCLQNNTECRTTDRITGRATSRGYVEGLEQQNRDLQHRLHELEHRLMQSGVDIKSSNGYHDSGPEQYGYGQPQGSVPPTWGQSSQGYSSPNVTSLSSGQHQEANMFRALPTFRAGLLDDNYLGVAPGNSHLSSISGTALSILGMEIDIADFRCPDMDEPDTSLRSAPLYNKSYQAFLQTIINVNPKLEKVELPVRSEGLTYAQWYFRVINPYCPLLHQATFMKLLTRMYDDSTFRPSTAETVMVHTVFAIMYFQYAVRNYEDAAQQANLTTQCNTHYHYALSHYYQLCASRSVHDIQAMALLCMLLRNFPKPGASWMLARTAMSFAIELGLHRSVKRCAPDVMPSPLQIEMRRRVFWVILTINITLSGKLGRPMPFRIEDYDAEMPQTIDDDLEDENDPNIYRPTKSLHEIGIQAFKLIPLYLELYSSIYSIGRRSENYVQLVNAFEAKIRAWKDALPAELVDGKLGANEQEGRVFALYAQSWPLEFRLLLRHPSVSMTTDPDFNAESMRICVESSRQMLGVVRQLQKFKSLDTTWYNTAVYVMAITTTLFAQWEKRGNTTTADLAALKEEMDIWLEIMGDLGALLGSGTRLREAVRVVADGTLGLLTRNLPTKNGNNTSSSIPPQDVKPSIEQPPSASNGYSATTQNFNYNDGSSNNDNGATNYAAVETQMSHSQTPYPAATQYPPYTESTSNTSDVGYAQQDTQLYSSYPITTTDPVEAPLLAAFAAQASQVAPNTWHRSSAQTNPASQAWQQWTSEMARNLEPQDCYSASALMQLGGRNVSNGESSQPNPAMNDMSNGVAAEQPHLGGPIAGMGATWPLNIFDIGQGGGPGN
ncbi:hypothetical protein CJF32_00008079 [Rutstroemia sp. NJR-2017a WRK4]|nr:hypothetical protein CJF32_00008079 [Rutstroemia sp. NJR-2017a WRK4]